MSRTEVADEAGVSSTTILRWMRFHGIETRPQPYARHLKYASSFTLSDEARQFIEGEVLGDGHLERVSRWSARYTHGSKHKRYLTWLARKLKGWGVEQSGSIYKWVKNPRRGVTKVATGYNYKTRSYAALLDLFDKWYFDGTKKVSRDLKLTPLVLRQWFLGDGTNSQYRLYFHTLCFDDEDVAYLSERLNRDVGIKARRWKNGEISIPRQFASRFFEYIGPCPKPIESIYGYKWTGT